MSLRPYPKLKSSILLLFLFFAALVLHGTPLNRPPAKCIHLFVVSPDGKKKRSILSLIKWVEKVFLTVRTCGHMCVRVSLCWMGSAACSQRRGIQRMHWNVTDTYRRFHVYLSAPQPNFWGCLGHLGRYESQTSEPWYSLSQVRTHFYFSRDQSDAPDQSKETQYGLRIEMTEWVKKAFFIHF